jgi:hypothetical protein
MNEQTSLSPAARWLGYAGLLPQALCLALTPTEYGYTAIAGGFAYAAAIFSFLGGVWWGQALASGRATTGAFVIAVMPSLLAVLLFLPWTIGWEWPAPALIYLGLFIAGSPWVDSKLGYASPEFFRLRLRLSWGLGALTVALGVVAYAMV